MSFASRILADSVSPDGARLTTYEATFPRFILAEVNTHRMLSRNSASSRAIPTEKIIQRVIDDPFVPMTFNRRVKGMGVGDALTEDAARQSRDAWLHARDKAVAAAQVLVDLDVDKSRVNRLLEPFMWHTAIITATEWDNFFGLRDHPAAQPEFQVIAHEMRKQMAESEPQPLDYGWWHLPLVTPDELLYLCEVRRLAQHGGTDEVASAVEHHKKLSASRCARVSFDRHTDTEPQEATIARADKLMTALPPHLSPLEHVARPFTEEERADRDGWLAWYLRTCEQQGEEPDPATIEIFLFSAHFRGWVQMRKEVPNEANALAAIEAAHTGTLAG